MPVANGVPARMDRLRALGNAVVPQVAEWVGRRIHRVRYQEDQLKMELGADGAIVLQAPATVTPTIRQIPGARYDSKTQSWRFPLSWATCVTARGVLGQALEVGPELAEWARRELDIRINPAIAIRNDALGIEDIRYSYQTPAVEFLNVAGSALLADEMGTGKSITTIRALNEAESFPAIIACSHSIKEQWEHLFHKWAPNRDVRVAPRGTAGAKKVVEEVTNGLGDVLVVGWSALRALSRLAPYGSIRLQSCSQCDPLSDRKPDLCQREDKVLNLMRWAAVVADEVHRAKNPKAEVTRALWAVGDRAGRRIGLTGTPIAEDAADLWAIMRFVAPEEYPFKWPWIERYADTSPNFFSGGVDIKGLNPATREELDRFFLPRFMRRTKAQVMPWLPPKVYERRSVELTGKQKQAYDSMKKEMVAAIEGGVLVADNVLIASLRLRQLASAYGAVISTDDAAPGDPMEKAEQQVRLEEPSSKLDVFEEVLAELGDQQAVIFAESSQLIELAYARVQKRTDKAAMIIGAVPPEKRAEIVKEFAAGHIQFVLATVGAAGEGVDGLQAASVGIFLQRPWSAIQNAQAEDRLHRGGQEADSVTYIDLVTKDTIEERVFRALKKKAARLQDVVGDDLGQVPDAVGQIYYDPATVPVVKED